MTDMRVELQRRLAAPAHRVFAAFADAKLIERWLRPAPEIGLTVVHLDFRIGGAYRFAYHVPGAGDVYIGGVYREINPPSRLRFTWIIDPPDEHAGITSEVIVTIDSDGGGALLTIRHEGWPRLDAVARHQGGWIGALDHLEPLLGETP